jgi:hypothetical protein
LELQINIPADAVDSTLAARFRWGEQGLTFTGPAAIGEVEDYFFAHNFLLGDYDHSGTVDQGDYLVWRMTLGSNVPAYSGADGSGNGVVDQDDYLIWRANFGKTLPAPGAGAAAGLADSGSSGASSGVAAAPEYVPIGSGAAVGGHSSQVTVHGWGSRPTRTGTDAVVGGDVASAGLASNSQLVAAISGNETASAWSSRTASKSVAVDSSTIGFASSEDLLLLDAAWADLSDPVNSDSYSMLDDGIHHSDQDGCEPELAAALFDRETKWWEAI